jgi:hypothetical protein
MSTKKFYITADAVQKATTIQQEVDNIGNDLDIDIDDIIDQNLKSNPLNVSALVCKLVGEWYNGGNEPSEVTEEELEGEFSPDQIKALENEEYLEHIQSDVEAFDEAVKTEGLFEMICNDNWDSSIDDIINEHDDELEPQELTILKWAVTNREYLKDMKRFSQYSARK